MWFWKPLIFQATLVLCVVGSPPEAQADDAEICRVTGAESFKSDDLYAQHRSYMLDALQSQLDGNTTLADRCVEEMLNNSARAFDDAFSLRIEALVVAADIAHRRQEPMRAVEYLTQALRLFPQAEERFQIDLAMVASNLGGILFEQKDPRAFLIYAGLVQPGKYETVAALSADIYAERRDTAQTWSEAPVRELEPPAICPTSRGFLAALGPA